MSWRTIVYASQEICITKYHKVRDANNIDKKTYNVIHTVDKLVIIYYISRMYTIVGIPCKTTHSDWKLMCKIIILASWYLECQAHSLQEVNQITEIAVASYSDHVTYLV